jgi:radical SAM superfamily enzyme YgiQ (UPF0313 family)
MKILLTNPPWEVEGKYGCRAGSRWPFLAGPPVYTPFPFFLAYATSYLQTVGIDAIFYDAIARMHSTQEFYAVVRSTRPDITLIETSTPSFNTDIKIAEEVSKFSEVCLAGPHATVFADELIKLPFISYILKGEYEKNSHEMCTTRRKGVYDFNHISDENFDLLPFPYRPEYSHVYKDSILGPQLPQLPIMESRGCPFRCTFCMWPPTMYGRKYRTFSNERILAEIEDCARRFKFNDIFFDSDTFGVCNPDKIINLAEDIHKFNIPWTVMSRADLHPLEVWLELLNNGCYGFRFGIETFSPRLSHLINKREKFDDVMKVIKGLKAAGARIHLCTMGGFPTETDEDRRIHESALSEMSRMGVGIQKSWMVPFPGTPYYQELKSKGMNFIDDWSCYSGESSNVKAKAMVDRICREYK